MIPGHQSFVSSNTEKLHIWRDYLKTAKGPVIFSDCDMLAISDPFVAFEESQFDVAITERTQPSRFPYNAGVVFARPTQAAIEFFSLWSEANDQMTRNEEFYRPYRLRYAGINQAALGYLMETGGYHASVSVLPCAKYNAVGKDQENLTQDVCLVHVKDILRKKVLRGDVPTGPIAGAMIEWYQYRNKLINEAVIKMAAVYYDPTGAYKDLLAAFKSSAREAMPQIDLDIVQIPEPPHADRVRKIAACFIASAEYAIASAEPVCVADIDLLFLRSIADIWTRPFDIAVTVRKGIPYNTGLWFSRPTPAAREFLRQWISFTHTIVDNKEQFAEFVQFHGGIDQASLALTLAENETANVLLLPCEEWNSCQDEWAAINERTRVVHIKSRLRMYCTGKIPLRVPALEPIVAKWRAYANTETMFPVDQDAADPHPVERRRRVWTGSRTRVCGNPAVSTDRGRALA